MGGPGVGYGLKAVPSVRYRRDPHEPRRRTGAWPSADFAPLRVERAKPGRGPRWGLPRARARRGPVWARPGQPVSLRSTWACKETAAGRSEVEPFGPGRDGSGQADAPAGLNTAGGGRDPAGGCRDPRPGGRCSPRVPVAGDVEGGQGISAQVLGSRAGWSHVRAAVQGSVTSGRGSWPGHSAGTTGRRCRSRSARPPRRHPVVAVRVVLVAGDRAGRVHHGNTHVGCVSRVCSRSRPRIS